MEHARCCRLRLIRSSWRPGRVEVRVVDRLQGYEVEGVADPLVALAEGRRVELEVELTCNTACVATVMGGVGEELRRAVGAVAAIIYSRSGDRETLSIEGLEASLVGEGGVVRLETRSLRLEGLESCLLEGARLIAERIEALLSEGVQVYRGSILEYGEGLEALAANSFLKQLLGEALGDETECTVKVVSGALRRVLNPLIAASLILAKHLGSMRVAYPVSPDFLAPVRRGSKLGNYGVGAAAVLAARPEESSLLISRLAGVNAEVVPVGDGYVAVSLRVEGEVLTSREVLASPRLAMAAGVAAALLADSKILVVHGDARRLLDPGVLRRELEKRGAILLYLKNG